MFHIVLEVQGLGEERHRRKRSKLRCGFLSESRGSTVIATMSSLQAPMSLLNLTLQRPGYIHTVVSGKKFAASRGDFLTIPVCA